MPDNIFGVDEAISDSHIVEGIDAFFETKDLIPDDGKPAPAAKKPTKIEGKKKPLIEEADEEEEEELEIERQRKKKEDESLEKTADSFFGGKENDEEEEEEEDKTKKKEGEGNEEDTEDEEEPEESQFEYLSKQMYEAGIFQPFDGEHVVATNEGEFAQLFRNQSVAQANEYLDGVLARHGDDRRQLFDAVFVNGVDPAKYLPAYNSVQSLENLSMDEEANQERVVREFYRRNGIAEDRISKKIEKLKEQAYLQEEAEDIYPQLLVKDKEVLEQQESAAKNKLLNEKAQDDLYKNSLIKVLQDKLKTKDLDGIPLTDKQANEIYDYVYTKRWKTPDGRRLTDFDVMINELNKPENIVNKLKIAQLYKTNFDFSKIKQKAISSQTNELFSKFAKKDSKKSPKQTKEDPNSKWGIEL